jgi:hypothetical protein
MLAIAEPKTEELDTQTVLPGVEGPAEWPTRIQIRVTDEDILLGARSSIEQCPIARALRRWVSLNGYPVVVIEVRNKRARVGMWHFQHDAEHFVRNFDHKKDVYETWVNLRRTRKVSGMR